LRNNQKVSDIVPYFFPPEITKLFLKAAIFKLTGEFVYSKK